MGPKKIGPMVFLIGMSERYVAREGQVKGKS